MITHGSSSISSLVPGCNPPKAVTLVLADGTLVPMLLLCQASVHGNPKGHYRNSHSYSPHGGSFCPQKQNCGYCSSGIRLALMSSCSASWSLKNDAGIHSASSAGYPCHRTKNSHCRHRVFEFHRHRRIFSTSKYSGLSGSSSSTSPGTCCTALCFHCFSSDT